jgi:multicomponent Na+:H+ antiporter subunit B
MTSLILRAAIVALEPLLLIFSLFLMLAGHNAPGGGFVGGLVAAAAFGLHALAYDAASARALLRIHPRTLIGVGLLMGLAAALLPLAVERPFFTGLWTDLVIPGFGTVAVGTPLLFDAGVYVLVAGVGALMVLTLAEE